MYYNKNMFEVAENPALLYQSVLRVMSALGFSLSLLLLPNDLLQRDRALCCDDRILFLLQVTIDHDEKHTVNFATIAVSHSRYHLFDRYYVVAHSRSEPKTKNVMIALICVHLPTVLIYVGFFHAPLPAKKRL